jgi:hypothetical protein
MLYLPSSMALSFVGFAGLPVAHNGFSPAADKHLCSENSVAPVA